MLSAAEKITSKLGGQNGPEYARWLGETIGLLKPHEKSRSVADALAALNIPIATTNYDSLLEQTTGLGHVTWRERAKAERILHGDDKGILHLHGYWSDPSSVVLGIRSYEQVLGDEHAQTVLRALAATRTLVFVGCGAGLRDPNFGTFLRWSGIVFRQSQYRRFLLARADERGSLAEQYPASDRMFVLPYGSSHDDLAGFLLSLVSSRKDSQPIPERGPIVVPLPGPPRCFGREKHLEAVVTNLLADSPQPATILGPPGIGKSTLCLAALHHESVARRFGDRRFFIRCDGLRSRSALIFEIARILMLPNSPTVEDAVLAELAKAPAVLALDNAETPWDEDTLEVESFLCRTAALKGLALIITVRGSERPAGVSWIEAILPAPLGPMAARDVFLSIAGKRFDKDLDLDRLLEAVDRVPLAVTLLAHAAEPEPNLKSLLDRWLQERTTMLRRAGGGDRLSNLELSYKLSLSSPRMTEGAKRLLTVMALLPNGVALGDLLALLPDESSAAAWTLRRTGLAFDDSSRLRLLAPLREFVKRSMAPNPEEIIRTASFYVGLANDQAGKVGRRGGELAASRLALEADNIEEMMLLAMEGTFVEGALSAVIKWSTLVPLMGFGTTRPVAAAVKVAYSKQAWQEAGECLVCLGEISLHRSDREEAGQFFEKGFSLFERIGNVKGKAKCVRSLGDVNLGSNQELAKSRYREALNLYIGLGDHAGQAGCLERLGDISMRRSDHGGASQLYADALVTYRLEGDVFGEGNCIQRLGDVAWERSDHDAARQKYEEARALFQKFGDARGEAICFQRLGDIALAVPDAVKARSCFDQALLLFRQLGNVLGEANCYKSLGDMALKEAGYLEAQKCFETAIPIYRAVDAVLGEANCLQRLGDMQELLLRPEEARKYFEDSLGLYEKIDQRFSIGWTQVRLARVDSTNRGSHIEEARAAWEGINRPDLIALLNVEGPAMQKP